MCFLYNVAHSVFVLIIASPAQDHVGGVFICRMEFKTMGTFVHLADIMSFQTIVTIRRGYKNTR